MSKARKFLGLPLKAGVAIGVVASLAAPGVASASIPDANGEVHACVNTLMMSITMPDLRLIDPSTGATCTAGMETTLAWNIPGARGATGAVGATGAQGPADPRGQTGPQGGQGSVGVQGPQGPAGTSGAGGAAFVTSYTGNARPGSSPIMTLNLPAGVYTLQGRVDGINGDGSAQDGTCVLSSGQATGVRLPASDGGGINNGRLSIPLQDVATLASAGTVTVSCNGFYNGSVTNGRLVAIKVDSVTHQ